MTFIRIKLYATLGQFTPDSADRFEISPGTSVEELLRVLNIPEDKARLVFIDGRIKDRSACLFGGERVGVFPPVGGG